MYTNLVLFIFRSDKGLTLETSAFIIPVRWSIYIINSVDKTKFCILLPHRRSTTVSTPFIFNNVKEKSDRFFKSICRIFNEKAFVLYVNRKEQVEHRYIDIRGLVIATCFLGSYQLPKIHPEIGNPFREKACAGSARNVSV